MSAAHTPREPGKFRNWLPPTSLAGIKQEFNDLMDGFFNDTLPAWRGEGPRVDIAETPRTVEITADLPGWHAEEIDIDVGENYVTLHGKRTEESTLEPLDRKLHRVERRTTNFSRSVWLPCPVNTLEVQAELAEGVLKVTLPKRAETKTHKVKVKPVTPVQPFGPPPVDQQSPPPSY